MKKLIIWDFDGVIADTEKLWVEVWQNFINKKYNFNWDDKTAHHNFAGVSVKTKLERLAKLNVKVTEEELNKILEEEIVKMHKEMFITKDIEDIFKNTNIKQCIATGGTLIKTLKKIKLLKLEKYFDKTNIFCADMVEHGKPEPDLFLYAAKKMGYQPSECIIIEDSIAGLTAAIRAGIDAVAFVEHQHIDKEKFIKQIKDLGIRYITNNAEELNSLLHRL